ncbi:hypothetical protein E2C01_031874 [Portunus trituberculatus]|uniref:Uncharacterized protein n=1 Tax=Portunus trituberculatus TaxID=210409 RepID=A0A5B7EZC5_PORTR|nr:hypothetical protein [Portunus trituberculatus]
MILEITKQILLKGLLKVVGVWHRSASEYSVLFHNTGINVPLETTPPHTYTQRHIGRVRALVGSGGDGSGGVVVAAAGLGGRGLLLA